MSVWAVNSIDQEPETTLLQWCVFSVDLDQHSSTIHFVGYAIEAGEGRVCSAIQSYDPATNRAITQSGRVYQLKGPPGINLDASYVWSAWLKINGKPAYSDITDQFYDFKNNKFINSVDIENKV